MEAVPVVPLSPIPDAPVPRPAHPCLRTAFEVLLVIGVGAICTERPVLVGRARAARDKKILRGDVGTDLGDGFGDGASGPRRRGAAP